MNRKVPHLAIIGVVFAFAFAQAESGKNLLKNPTFASVGGGGAQSWEFSTFNFKDKPEVAEQLEWKRVKEEDGTYALYFSTRSNMKSNQWWQQLLPTVGGETYTLSVEAKGVMKPDTKYASVSVGVYFLDANDRWLGYQDISGAKVSAVEQWTRIEGTVSAPEDAAKMGVRFGSLFEGGVEISFKDPALTVGSN